MTRDRLGALVVCLVLAVACGSTVPLAGPGVVASEGTGEADGMALGTTDDGLAAPAGASQGAAGSGAGQSATGAPLSAGGDGADPLTPASSGGGNTSAGGGAGQGQSSGPGSDEPLRLGLVVPSGDPARAFGASIQSEDYPVIARAVVEDLNERGGLAGRSVDPVIREASQDDQSEEAQTRQAQEICESLTNDAKVHLVAAAGNSGTLFGLSCYAQHQTPLLIPGLALDDRAMSQFAPWLLPPSGPNVTTIAAELPRQLARQGVLTEKIGILAFDLPYIKRAVEETFKPAIARHGGTVLETVYMQVSYQDVGAQVSSAVLQFKAQGIDLVLPSFAVGGGATGIFMHEAETQGYRPRYGLSSLDGPIVIDGTLNAPESQLRNAVGVGYDPTRDVANNQLAPSRNERRCWNMVNKRLGTGYRDRTATGGNGFAALEMCELIWQLESALAPWEGRTFDPAALRTAVEALGTSYTPVSLPAARFARGRPDGSAVQRAFHFDAGGCGCFTYRGGWVPIRR
jgi:hypothetical protein